MKKKLLFCAMFLATCCGSIIAQRKQISEDYLNAAFDNVPFNLFGKMNYSCVIGEDGENIKDGPLSINCKVNKKFEGWAGVHYATIKVLGNFTANANYQKGALNGTLRSNYKVTLSEGVKNEVKTASMSGSFIKGVPNGNFMVKRDCGLKTTLNANFKNGVLVGAYSCSLLDEDGRLAQYSGTLTQDGKPTGKWELNGNTATFQNGVLISLSTKNKSTKPALVEKTKNYLAGKNTKEDLFKESIIVKKDSIELGEYARTAIFRDSGLEFDKIGGYDFTNKNVIYYEFLEEVAVLNEKGIETLKQEFSNWYVYKKPILEDFFAGSIEIYGDQYPHISIYRQRTDYYTTNSTLPPGDVRAFMTQEQHKEIYNHVDSLLKTKAMPLNDYIIKEVGEESMSGKFLQGKLDDCSDEDFKEVKRIIEARYLDFKNNCKSCKNDSSLFIINSNSIGRQIPFNYKYVFKESVEDFALRINNFDKELEELKIKNDIKNAMSLNDFIVIHKFANDDALSYLSGKEAKKKKNVIEGLEMAYEKFNEGRSLYNGPDDLQAYIYNINGVNIYVNKESVDSFGDIIEEAKNARKNSRKKAINQGINKAIGIGANKLLNM